MDKREEEPSKILKLIEMVMRGTLWGFWQVFRHLLVVAVWTWYFRDMEKSWWQAAILNGYIWIMFGALFHYEDFVLSIQLYPGEDYWRVARRPWNIAHNILLSPLSGLIWLVLVVTRPKRLRAQSRKREWVVAVIPDSAQREELRFWLKIKGYRPFMFRKAAEAKEWLEDLPSDVKIHAVILDPDVPSMIVGTKYCLRDYDELLDYLIGKWYTKNIILTAFYDIVGYKDDLQTVNARVFGKGNEEEFIEFRNYLLV